MRWKEFHSLLRKAYLRASNVDFGDVGMSWVFQCDKPHDAFQVVVVLCQVSKPCLARCREALVRLLD